MSYTDSLLAQGEVIAMRSKQHWLALLLDARNAVAAWLVAALLFAATIVFNIQGDARNVLGIIVLVLFVVGLLLFAWQWLQWINSDYVVTNRRILKVSGIVNKKSMDSSLEKVNDLILEENLLGRILDYGDLDVVTASDVAIDRFRMLHHAKTFKKEMLDQKHELEQGDFYRPSPPLMASSPGSAAFAPPPATEQETAAAPPAYDPPSAAPASSTPGMQTTGATFTTTVPGSASTAPLASSAFAAPTSGSASDASTADLDATVAAPPPVADVVPPPAIGAPAATPPATASVAASALDDPEDEARDITRTLSRLADLRDRGAITAEDYEAKKQELLGRL